MRPWRFPCAAVLAASAFVTIGAAFSAAEPARAFRDCPECPEMLAVPAGRFRMGAPESEVGSRADERPVREVLVRSFALGRYEVTLGEYALFAADTGRASRGECVGPREGGFDRSSGLSFKDPGYRQTDRHPAVCVSWVDAWAYAAWLAKRTGKPYRLPSEAEWEYAARAGTTTPFAWGEEVNGGEANYDGAYRYAGGPKGPRLGAASPVGSFPPNAFGFYDMAGNVWEWVRDCRHRSYQGAPVDGSAWLSEAGGECGEKIRRGGSWDGYASSLRSANRYWNDEFFKSAYDGFRVARDLP